MKFCVLVKVVCILAATHLYFLDLLTCMLVSLSIYIVQGFTYFSRVSVFLPSQGYAVGPIILDALVVGF